jgi:hypothetical protein
MAAAVFWVSKVEIYRYRHEIGVSDMRGWCGENVRNGGTSLGKGHKHIMIIYGKAHQCRRFVSSFAGNMVFLKSFKYGTVQNVLSMAMSKKDMTRRSSKKRAMLEELEKQAASGSGDAKKKLAKAKKKMK